jgi:hypothetical protein
MALPQDDGSSVGRLPQLGGSWPTTLGWACVCAIPIVIVVDTTYEALRRRGSRGTSSTFLGWLHG